MILASFLQKNPLKFRRNSFTCSMQMNSTLNRSLEMPLSYTKDTMVISALNLQTWSCQPQPILKSQRRGSMLRVGHSSVELPFHHLVLRARIGRLSGMVHTSILYTLLHSNLPVIRAVSEVVDCTLPYDDILSLRDRMWEISPALLRYDVTERTSAEVAALGVKMLATSTAGSKASGVPFRKPIDNFYQTDPISRAQVSIYSFEKIVII